MERQVPCWKCGLEQKQPLNSTRLEDDKFKARLHYTAKSEACLAEQEENLHKKNKVKGLEYSAVVDHGRLLT